MKKYILFAAALLGLVACNNKEEVTAPLEPGKPCTLTATIDLNSPNQSSARMIAPVDPSAASVAFTWQNDDQITISNGKEDPQVFTIVNSSISGNTANFEGTALTDMSSYTITYGNTSSKSVDYIAGSYKPFATGEGANNEFTINSYSPVLELKLTGAVTLTSIKYYVNDALSTTLNMGDGVALTSTATTIYFPVIDQAAAESAKLEFCDANGVVMSKTAPVAIENSKVFGLPELEVKAAPADYICFTALENSTVGPTTWYSGIDKFSLEWKKNNGNWEEVTSTSSATSLNQGDKLYVRAHNANSQVTCMSYTSVFAITGNVKLSGNIMALLNQNPGSASIGEDCFKNIFKDQTALTDASELILPATTLAQECYVSMFEGCTNLAKAPALPATTLANSCYSNMFRKCSSLVKTPELPATQLANECYKYMFKGCTSLVNAPVLPATTLTEECYHSMFDGCTSLVNAPELPVTTLAKNCYGYMFKGCSNLVKAPELPATTLANYCYSHMFENCSNLETAPVLSAATLVYNCYNAMFYNCSKLSSVTMLATSVGKNEDVCLVAWLYNTASSGTIYAANTAAITAINNLDYSKYSGGGPKPAGWTITVKP